MKKSMWTVISFILLGYGALVILVYVFQSKLLFFPGPVQSGQGVLKQYTSEEITIEHDHIKLHGWYLRPDSSRTIFYYGGNAEEVSLSLSEFDAMKDYGVVLINYRGYGHSEGSPGQDELFSDALYIFDFIKEKYQKSNQEIILMGRSLGSGVAAYVASQRDADKIILITPYDSITEIAKKHYPFLPVNIIVKHPFNSKEYVSGLNIPALILSAEYDHIIPLENTQRLIESFPDSVSSYIIKGTDHNSIQMSFEYHKAIKKFLAK
jgi:pimeloyl-ACP methyl ester carboxylesterase